MSDALEVLNLYAGIGGNRKLWGDVEDVNVTAVEWDADKADVYRDYFPDDRVIEADAHEYLLDHYDEYDFIWTSPPCPTHSKTQIMSVLSDNERAGTDERDAVYPDMKLYQEIILLRNFADCDWVVENVTPYYDPLIQGQRLGRHLFWSNYHIDGDVPQRANVGDSVSDMSHTFGYDLSGYGIEDKRKTIRNCVDPELGKHVFASRGKQTTLGSV